MEYSKEDLMEAKKQIWGVGENMGTEESKKIWEENAQFWDNAMGDESNEFHREVVRPKVTELLSPNPADYILDIACGNGNYSSYLAQRGASVVAFDYSKKMIELAKRRQSQYAKQIEFCVADATDRKSIQHPGNLGGAVPGKAQTEYLLYNRCGLRVNNEVSVRAFQIAIDRLAGDGFSAHAFSPENRFDFLARVPHHPFIK